jgi:hypothetical protein
MEALAMAMTARISKTSDKIIHEMSTITHKNKIEIIEEALVLYRHYERMRMLNESFENLRANEHLWEEELKERKELEGTLLDGLDDE